jgi:hypothetical protein
MTSCRLTFLIVLVRIVDGRRSAELRAQGTGWKRIAAEMGIGVGTLSRLAREGSKIREKVS